MTHDGLGKYLKEKITKAPGPTADIVQILKDTSTDVVVSYLPVGSEQATKWYVEQILEAGCGFVNCIPVFIAREDYWNDRFVKAGLPIVGDDIKSQVGATIVHRTLARLFHDRASSCCAPASSTSAATWTSTTCSSASGWSPRRSPRPTRSPRLATTLPDGRRAHRPVGLRAVADRPKWAHIRLEGQAFGDVPLELETQARGLGLARTRPASSSTPCAAASSP